MKSQQIHSAKQAVKEHIGVKESVRGIIAALAVTVPVFLVFAVILSFTDFPEKLIAPVVTVTTVISALLAGMSAAKGVRKRGWLGGVAVGIIYFLLLYIAGGIVYGDFAITGNIAATAAICAISGSIGGIAGINLTKTPRR